MVHTFQRNNFGIITLEKNLRDIMLKIRMLIIATLLTFSFNCQANDTDYLTLSFDRHQAASILKQKLNSDRIKFLFGSYGVDPLNIQSSVFPNSRISNLHSTHDGKKIMRTLAVVNFEGKSGITL